MPKGNKRRPGRNSWLDFLAARFAAFRPRARTKQFENSSKQFGNRSRDQRICTLVWRQLYWRAATCAAAAPAKMASRSESTLDGPRYCLPAKLSEMTLPVGSTTTRQGMPSPAYRLTADLIGSF